MPACGGEILVSLAHGAKNLKTAATTLRRRSITEENLGPVVSQVQPRHAHALCTARIEFLRRTTSSG